MERVKRILDEALLWIGAGVACGLVLIFFGFAAKVYATLFLLGWNAI